VSAVAWQDLRTTDPDLEELVRIRLERVEESLRRSTSSDLPFISEAAGYLLAAGGKRFRPLLVMLGGNFGDPDDPRLIQVAVAVELTHLATLYHDDVIDEAATRRGTASANARWDNTVAILTGDFLFARASEICSDLGAEVTRVLARTIATVCEGQIREVQIAGNIEADQDAYVEVIRRKTASLIATSCRLGGLLSGAPQETVEGLERFGHALGVAFQFSDDIMDVTADASILGKEPGADLREGVFTLPVIYALRDPGQRGQLRTLLGGPLSSDDLAHALEMIRSGDGLDRAREAVSSEVRGAIEIAAGLPEGRAREALIRLAEFIATRCGAPI
jgi:geranylgeranyl pyrophosphate synthase